MSLESNDSFLRLTIKELPKEDPFYAILENILDHVQISFVNQGSSENGISVVREGFSDSFVGTYALRENGSGQTIGLFKNVEGQFLPISPALPGEIRLLQGGGTGELVPPKGWQIITDEEIVHKFNVGTSPNWTVAAIKYTGI